MRKLGMCMVAAATCGLFGLYACSGSDKPPPPGPDTHDGSDLKDFDGTVFSEEASVSDSSSSLDASSDASLPPSCTDTIMDNLETDVDCGGGVCNACIDGKNCVASTDCAGGFCDTVQKKCVTPTCNDMKINGKESDVDCGGGICSKCSFGKKCAADTDCVSTKCDTTLKTCSCPDRMVVSATNAALGGAYCIDQTEVTSGDYNRFVNANQSISQQIRGCAATNTSFVPSGNWPPPQPLSIGYPVPVRSVDWCDAFAYCRWAGKQLCGKIGGGGIDVDGDAGDAGGIGAALNYSEDAWMNACSAQGTNLFPYGSSFINLNCNSEANDGGAGGVPLPVCSFSDQGAYVNIPADTAGTHYRTCQGGDVDLYGMSGNVEEWEDACSTDGSACLTRGGGYLSATTAELQCNAYEQLDRMTHRSDVGFRCCQF